MRGHLRQIFILFSLGLGACAPLVRYGDIEPTPGQQTLINVEVRPQREGVPQSELAAAVGAVPLGLISTAPAPVVPTSVVTTEISSSVQSSDVMADDALIDETELAGDARRLEAIYMARGYYRAKSRGHRLVAIKEDRATAIFEVNEGDPTLVSEVLFKGACEDIASESDAEARKRREKLCRQAPRLVPLREGDIWDEELYATGLSELARAFRNEGFLHARVTGDTWVSLDQYKAAIWYQISPGPLVRVRGEPRVEGYQRIPLERILRRIELKPGDVLDNTSLRRVERRISELGPFFAVQASALRPEGRSQRRQATEETASNSPPSDSDEPRLTQRMPLKVQVAEAPRWELTVGPSIITDFVGLDLALPIRFVHRNLFNEVIALDATARPALIMPNCFTATECLDNVQFGINTKAGLQVPSFFEEYLKLSFDLLYRRDPSQETKTQELGGSIGISRRIIEGLSARFGYNLAYFNYFDTGAFGDLANSTIGEDAAFRFQTQDWLAWLDFTLSFDIRDNPLDARNGFFTTLTAHIASPWVGSEVEYNRLIGDLRGYWTPEFAPWLTLAARLKLGWNFFTGDGTPQPARFRSGGASSHRGFATDRIGDFVCSSGSVLNDSNCDNKSSQRTYIGGNYLIESNVELRFRFRNSLGFALFADIGRLWSLEQDVDLSKLHIAIGPGLRYDLPIGPVRVDFGFLLGKQSATAFHFSLGQAF